ncbi:MAG: TrkH family potassium uptake protein [Desulfovibrionaceae bacterium]
MKRTSLAPTVVLPVYAFLAAIIIGAGFLHHRAATVSGGLSWLDAVFTATSAVCVTGLSVVDTGASFTPLGKGVILGLIQLGGLGIMTYSTLAFYLLRRRITLTDRIAVGQALLHDPSFQLGPFLLRIGLLTACVEGSGALLLYTLDPVAFHPASAVFHAISAFCNAGFSLFSDSLVAWRGHLGINLVFMALIILGGLGFAVIDDVLAWAGRGKAPPGKRRLSRHTRIVLETTMFLLALGFAAIYISELHGGNLGDNAWTDILAALFQSVTARTAGFNTLDVGGMTNAALLFLLVLMYVGGSPGSCAGGIKTTTARVLIAFAKARVHGSDQVVINGRAVDKGSLDKALTLFFFSSAAIVAALVIMTFTEGGDLPHPMVRGKFLELLFEIVSAFGTVGLSTGVTPYLSPAGKCVIIALMFIGRLGPIWLLTVVHSWQRQPRFRYPEEETTIG